MSCSRLRRSARITLLGVVAAVALAGSARAQAPIAIRVTVDTGGPSTRLVLTASKAATAAVTASRGKIEIVYAAPVEFTPAEGRPDDGILVGWSARGERTLVVRTGSGYRSHEVFNLRNPSRVIIDLEGDRPSRLAGPRGSESRPKFVVVVDPGHGGVETGAVGPSRTQEKDIALDLARRLKAFLQKDPGTAVVLTRDEDRLVPLDERTAIANHNHADLFLSIHLNSSRRPKAFGAETYFLSPDATDDDARTVAALENRAYDSADPGKSPTLDAVPGLNLVLWDLAQNEYLAESGRLAESIQSELNALAGTKNRGVRQAPFRVLMGATMPAVLVEVGFISNPEEDARFQQEEHKAKVVEAIARAIDQFRQGAARFEIPKREEP